MLNFYELKYLNEIRLIYIFIYSFSFKFFTYLNKTFLSFVSFHFLFCFVSICIKFKKKIIRNTFKKDIVTKIMQQSTGTLTSQDEKLNTDLIELPTTQDKCTEEVDETTSEHTSNSISLLLSPNKSSRVVSFYFKLQSNWPSHLAPNCS